jgi:hypothetical protein
MNTAALPATVDHFREGLDLLFSFFHRYDFQMSHDQTRHLGNDLSPCLLLASHRCLTSSTTAAQQEMGAENN